MVITPKATLSSQHRVDELQKQRQFQPERNAAYAEAQRIYNEQLNAIYLALTNYASHPIPCPLCVVQRHGHSLSGFIPTK